MPELVSSFESKLNPMKTSLCTQHNLCKRLIWLRLRFLQCFDTYLIIKSSDAVWMLDQHAVHERILYEKN